jgi:hypothetical protein
MQDEGLFSMRERGVSEDVADFMERLKVGLGRDHKRRNPECREEKTEYIKMHAPAGKPFGFKYE